jgi:phospholipase/carboxylesterase
MHVMLLHGFGAPADDLVPLAQVLDVRAQFSFPAAPLEYFGGRAWWMLDPDVFDHPERDRTNELPDGLTAARSQVLAAIEQIDGPLVIGGFSQGAMLACDVALHTSRPLAALVLMSATLIDAPEWKKLAPSRKGLPVFQSHGTRDPLLTFEAAEKLRDLLAEGGLAVEFHPFRGGHEIPAEILARLAAFLNQRIS